MGGLGGIMGLLRQNGMPPSIGSDIEQAASQAPQQLGQALQNQQQVPEQQTPQQQPDSLESLKDSLFQQWKANQPKPPSGGPVRHLLQNFFSGMGNGMMTEAGVQTPEEKQNQLLAQIQGISAAQSNVELHKMMAGQYGTTQIDTPDGPVSVLNKDVGKILQSQIRQASAAQVQGMKNDAGAPILDAKQAAALNHPEWEGMELNKAVSGMLTQQAGKIPITDEMVTKYGMPSEAVGKYAKLSDILAAERNTMTRTSTQWKPDGLGGYIPLQATSTRTFGKGQGASASPSATGGTPSGASGGASRTSSGVAGKGPVYAFNPKTNETVLTTQAEAEQGGMQAPRKVSQTNIEQDRQLNNRLYDVAAKIHNYEQSMSQPISDLDRSKMADLLSNDQLKLGAFGLHVGTDWIHKLTQAMSTAGLSPSAQQRLINYYNVREAMTGYTRVLTGSGRSSDTNLHLNLDAMPSPIMPDNFTKQGIDQFKQNVHIAGQGLPRMPGVQKAEDVLNPPKHVAGGQASGLTEGAKGRGSDGNLYVVRGGVWVPQ